MVIMSHDARRGYKLDSKQRDKQIKRDLAWALACSGSKQMIVNAAQEAAPRAPTFQIRLRLLVPGLIGRPSVLGRAPDDALRLGNCVYSQPGLCIELPQQARTALSECLHRLPQILRSYLVGVRRPLPKI